MKLNKKAFTLVELLAVIVVLAIVAAIAMRSITGIVKNSRRDSFISSVNAAIEGADMACVQDGDLSDIQKYVKSSGVTVAPTTNGFTVTAKTGGEFASLKGSDLSASKVQGVASDKVSFNTTAPAVATITYSCD